MSAPAAALDRYAVVVPSLLRPSLEAMLRSLAAQTGPLPQEVVVVDDRPTPGQAPRFPDVVTERLDVRVVPGFGRGPAAARNLGWRLTSAPWVVFLDDDVLLPQGWAQHLADDLVSASPQVGGVAGRIVVPLPQDRPPTDWERSTAGLESAQWVTADLAYRRSALLDVEGFDERFPRAYREDADLALRARRAGWDLVRGTRTTHHPVRPVGPGVSVRVQRGNADDALMRRLHGPQWRRLAETGTGRLPWHIATVAFGAAALSGLAPRSAAGRRRLGAAGLLGWALLTAEFAWRRIAPGPRSREEVGRMVWTSVAIPPVAVWHRVAGWWRHRRATAWPPAPRAVLFDRDGTLVHDVPYNGDPAAVRVCPDAVESVQRLRSRGLRLGVVSNQSGIARGLLSRAEVDAVNAEIETQLGSFDTWQLCPHGPDDGCLCRKPAPGMVQAAARHLGVRPQECVVVGDIGADVLAARAAGARGILIPTAATRPEEVAAAPVVTPDLRGAVDVIEGWGRG